VNRTTLAAIRGRSVPARTPLRWHWSPRPQTAQMKKCAAHLNNIYFLSCIGPSLRWATEDTARDELPTKIKELLTRLEQLKTSIRRRAADLGNRHT
jgi:hypothetical protein